MIDGTDGNRLTKALELEGRAKDDFLELLQSIGRAKKAGHVTGNAQREERKKTVREMAERDKGRVRYHRCHARLIRMDRYTSPLALRMVTARSRPTVHRAPPNRSDRAFRC
jgi:hypothetical protein